MEIFFVTDSKVEINGGKCLLTVRVGKNAF